MYRLLFIVNEELIKRQIAHQTESHNEAIAQLQREVSQLKDQSRNWQNHFLRVEQERCAQSSRIDELLKLQVKLIPPFFLSDLKFLQYTHPINTTPNTIHPHIINSAPSSLTTKRTTISSPTKPPSYISAVLSTSDSGSCSDARSLPYKPRKMIKSMPLKRRKIPLINSSEEGPQPPTGERHRNPSSSKRKNKGNEPKIVASSSSQRQDPQNAASHTTLIRRVQAVVHIKREESDDDYAVDVFGGSDEDEVSKAIQHRSSRRSIRNVVDDWDDELNDLSADGNPVRKSRHLRHRNGIFNYREEDEDEDDVDELMIGAEVHMAWIGYFYLSDIQFQGDEILGAQISKPPSLPPPKKKRKVAAR